jgi:hypothetical protein
VIEPRVRIVNSKHLRISGLNRLIASCLVQVPEILDQRDAASSRLLPTPTTHDEKANEEWRRLVAPELRHLFVSAGETFARDLARLKPDANHPGLTHIAIPLEHVNAWMTALNQARLILGEVYLLDERDMNNFELDVEQPKHRAVLIVHVLGEVLHLLVEFEGRRNLDRGVATAL